MDFYEKVIYLCRQNGISRSKMADDVGISRSTPKDWADKRSTPQFSTVKKIADYFGVSPTYLTDDNSVNISSVQNNNGIICHTNINGNEKKLTEQEVELLSIFESLSVIDRAKLLIYAAELKCKNT